MKKFGLITFMLIQHFGFSQILNYNFTSAASTFANNTSPTTIHGSLVDDVLSPAINIGFNFEYNCQTYTQFKASSNGWLTFNTAITGSANFNNLSGTTSRPIIAPLWDDLETHSTGNVNYQLTGTSPNRVLTVEWKEMRWNSSETDWALSFQVKLYETSNRIEFIYFRNGSAGNNVTNGATGSIGLVGQSAGDYYSLDGVGNTPAASKTTETNTLDSKPPSGRIYRWDPVVCSGAPTPGTAVATPSVSCSNFTTTLSLSGTSGGCGLTYLWYHSNTASGTYTAIGTATNTPTQTFPVTSSSTKFFKCVVFCGASSATTAVISASVNSTVPGTGNFSISSFPYNSGNQSTCGMVNDITPTSVNNVCGSSNYYDGEDVIYAFTPTVNAVVSATVTSTGSWMGMTLYEGCPTGNGTCVDFAQSSSGNQSLTSCNNNVTAGNTYYIILDSYPSPTCNPYNLTVNLTTCSGTPSSGTASAIPNVMCSNYTTTLSLSGHTNSCGIFYQWFHSNSSTGTYSAITTATSVVTQTFAITSTSPKFFKCVVTCGAFSATTAVISASVNPSMAGTGSYSVSLPLRQGQKQHVDS